MPPPQLPSNVKDMLAALMGYSLNLGQGANPQFGNIWNELNRQYNFNTNQLANRANFQDQFAQSQIEAIRNAISQGAGMKTGLPPEALAALQGQAIEAVPERFDRLGEQMRTQLMRRGALGGEMPASAGDYLRDIGGLEQAKESERARGLRETAFANEAARQQNRQAMFEAAGLQNQLLGQGANIYNPLPWAQMGESNLNQMLGTLLGQTGTQFKGLEGATGLAGLRTGMESESLRNMLLSALLGTGGNILSVLFESGGLLNPTT